MAPVRIKVSVTGGLRRSTMTAVGWPRAPALPLKQILAEAALAYLKNTR